MPAPFAMVPAGTIHQQITIFGEDDATPIVGTVDGSGTVTDPTASTDPAHTRPFLWPLRDGPRKGIDLLEGRAQIGQVNLRLLDKRTSAADQDTGWLTALLPDSAGRSALMGRRLLLEGTDGSSQWPLFDGPIGGVQLAFGDLVELTLSVRDMRERARKVSPFNWTDSIVIFPRGVVRGWGGAFYHHDFGFRYFLNPVSPIEGTFEATGDHAGYVRLPTAIPAEERNDPLAPRAGSPMMLDYLQPTDVSSPDGSDTEIVFGNHAIEWRAAGSADPWTRFERPVISIPDSWNASLTGGRYDATVMSRQNELVEFVEGGEGRLWASAVYIGTQDSGQWPADGAAIEIRVRWHGPASEATPQHLYGPFNEVIPSILDGYYFRDDEWNIIDPRLPYNQAAFDRFAKYTVAGRITEPVAARAEDGLRAMLGWLEKHAFKPLGLAPGLNADHELVPVSFELPENTSGIVQLDETNVLEMDWEHSSDTVINRVLFKYKRYSRGVYESVEDITAFDGIEVTDRSVVVAENDLLPLASQSEMTLGRNTHEVETSLYGPDMSGNVFLEAGLSSPEKLAVRLAFAAFDRYLLGGQYARGTIARSAGLDTGDWAVLAVPWLPDYRTGTRGMSRLVQVVDATNVDELLMTVELVDAGPSHTPAPNPTLSGASASVEGYVTATIDTIPQDATYEHAVAARVEYAVSDTQPASTGGEWLFLGRYDTTGAKISDRPAPPGTLWVRVRGEAPGMVPSSWTVYGPFTVPARAALADLRVTILPDDGSALVTWIEALDTAGVRVEADQHEEGADPDWSAPSVATQELVAGTEEVEFDYDTVSADDMFSVRVTPFTGFSGGAVSGTPGQPWQLTLLRGTVVDAVRWPTTSLSAVFEETDPNNESSIYAQGEAGFWTAGVLLRLYAEDGTLLHEETAYADAAQVNIGVKSDWTHRFTLEPEWGDQILRLAAIPTALASIHGDAGGLEGPAAEVALYIASVDIKEPIRSFEGGPDAVTAGTGTSCSTDPISGYLQWHIDGLRSGDYVTVQRSAGAGTIVESTVEDDIGHVPGDAAMLLPYEYEDEPAADAIEDAGGELNEWQYVVRVYKADGTMVASETSNTLSLNLTACGEPQFEGAEVTVSAPADLDSVVGIDIDADRDQDEYEYEVHGKKTVSDGVNPDNVTNFGDVTGSLDPALPADVEDAIQSTTWDSTGKRDDAGANTCTIEITVYLKRKSDGAVADTAIDSVGYSTSEIVPS